MKIPENAKLVHKGIIYDVYNWNQELFDGSKKIFEGLKRRPAVQVFAVGEEGIILLEEEQPGQESYLSIPGGGVDSDDVLACAKRELLEETGFASDDWTLWKKLELGLNIEFYTYYYIARNCRKTGNQSLDKGGEKIKIKFMQFDDFLETLKNGRVRNEALQAMITSIKCDKNKAKEFSNLLFNF